MLRPTPITTGVLGVALNWRSGAVRSQLAILRPTLTVGNSNGDFSMKTRSLLAILIFVAFTGCSSGGDENAADTGSTDPDAESTDAEVTAVAGSLEMKGMDKTQLIHIISNGEPGTQPAGSAPSAGSGTATVTREGQRVRFEIDGISGTTGKSLKMTLVCEREGQWV